MVPLLLVLQDVWVKILESSHRICDQVYILHLIEILETIQSSLLWIAVVQSEYLHPLDLTDFFCRRTKEVSAILRHSA